MEGPNRVSIGRHLAAGGRRAAERRRREAGDADVVDLATRRAIRLLVQAGMVAGPAVPPRRGTVR